MEEPIGYFPARLITSLRPAVLNATPELVGPQAFILKALAARAQGTVPAAEDTQAPR